MKKNNKINNRSLDHEILSPISELLTLNRIQTVEELKAYTDKDGNNILIKVIHDLANKKLNGLSNLEYSDALIMYLINCGVEINQQNTKDLFPLDYATQFGFKNIIKILIEKKSDVNIQNSLNIAYQKKDIEILRLLLTKVPERDRREVLYQCYRNKYVLDTRYKVGNQGYNAMHDSIANNNIDDLRFILATIDSPNTQTLLEDYSALHLICQSSQRLPMLNVIINERSDLIKSIYGNDAIIENLNVNLQDRDGDTPMHILLRELNGIEDIFEYIKLLCQKGADVSIKNNEGCNPVNIAISSCILNEDSLKILIAQAGNNIDLNELLSFAQEKNNRLAQRIVQEYIDKAAYCFVDTNPLKEYPMTHSDKPIVNTPSDIKLPNGSNNIGKENPYQGNQVCRLM